MNIMNLYVYENRSMSNDLSRPLMLENLNVDNVQIHIPKEIDETDMGTWAWWFVYQNAKREKYSIPMTLEAVTNDEGEEEYISTVGLNHGFTGKHGTVMHAIEALQADGSGAVTHEWHTKTYKLDIVYTLQGNQTEYDESESDIISALISRVNELIQSGAEIAEIAETIEHAAETAQEVIDSIPADYSTLSAQVDTNTEDIDGLKADLDYEIEPYNAVDLLYKNRTYSNGTHNGVTYTFNGNQCSLSGTASDTSFRNIYSGRSNLPNGMKAGDVIHFKYSTSKTSVRLCVLFYDANNQQIGGAKYCTANRDIEIPSDAVGMIVRIDVTSDAVTNITVTFGALLVLSNAELKSYTDTVASELIQAKSANEYVSDSTITLSDIKKDGFYVIATNLTVTDAPENLAVTGLTVEHFSVNNANGFIKQTAESLLQPATTKKYYRVSNSNGSSWSEWVEIGGTINNYTINQYANEYNVTATPSITADTNNYLQPTGDQTDMAPAIMAMLTQSGVCNLAPGIFYVSGVDMPMNTIIRGCGVATNIILLNSVSEGYAIKMGSNCIVEDVKISGGTSAPTITSTIGTRHGIIWQGTATPSSQTSTSPTRGTISNVHLWYFSGSGLKCYGTGTGISNCLNVVNVYARECAVGINVELLSEFHRFTNVDCRGCYYGCINNGGNNIFVNCGFSKNIVGLLMDNSNNKSPNNSHGTFSGCVFNHSGNNNDGIAIHIIGCGNAEMFVGCQVFFGSTVIENSSGIVFSACNYKGSTGSPISINGGGLVKLVDCVFGSTANITITNNTATVVDGCYLRDGTAVAV